MTWISSQEHLPSRALKIVMTLGSSCPQRKPKKTVNERRKTLRHLRKRYIDDIEEKEGVMYEAGAF